MAKVYSDPRPADRGPRLVPPICPLCQQAYRTWHAVIRHIRIDHQMHLEGDDSEQA